MKVKIWKINVFNTLLSIQERKFSQSQWLPKVLDHLNTRTACSNPAQGVEICQHFSILCHSVQIQVLQLTNPLHNVSCQMS